MRALLIKQPMTRTLTVDLSEAVYQHLQQIAVATQQPLEQVVRQSIEGNLPPALTGASPDVQKDLLALQTRSATELRQLAESEIAPEQQARHLELLEKNAANRISATEQAELLTLRTMADQLMLRKAYALALLRWRGYPLPDFAALAPN